MRHISVAEPIGTKITNFSLASLARLHYSLDSNSWHYLALAACFLSFNLDHVTRSYLVVKISIHFHHHHNH